PAVEARIRRAGVLITSRLSLVESARALHRLRLSGQVSEARLADAERATAAVWARCELWELTPTVCEAARHVAPSRPLRALDTLPHPPARRRSGSRVCPPRRRPRARHGPRGDRDRDASPAVTTRWVRGLDPGLALSRVRSAGSRARTP